MRFYLVVLAFFASACSSTSLQINSKDWRYATDPHGSYARYSPALVHNNQVAISFFRVPRVDKQNNSWVELIYDLPMKTLTNKDEIEITYQSDNALIVKLSQVDYGAAGDKSYAHYQLKLPSSTTWRTERVTLSRFTRPDWTPAWSIDKGIVPQNIAALYFVPDLTDQAGGNATIAINQVSLH